MDNIPKTARDNLLRTLATGKNDLENAWQIKLRGSSSEASYNNILELCNQRFRVPFLSKLSGVFVTREARHQIFCLTMRGKLTQFEYPRTTLAAFSIVNQYGKFWQILATHAIGYSFLY